MELNENFESRKGKSIYCSIRPIIEDGIVNEENTTQIIGSNSNEKYFSINKIMQSSYFGILCSVLSSVFVTLSSTLLKEVPHFDWLQQTLLGNIWLIVGSLPVAVLAKNKVFDRPKHSFITFLRVVVGTVSMYTLIVASRHLPLAELAILAAAIPSMSTVLARVFLKEQCGVVHIFTLFLTAVGVLLALRLPELLQRDSSGRFTAQYIIGLIAQVAFVICMSLTGVLIRMIPDVHFSVQQSYIGLLGSLVGACVVAATGVQLPHCGWEPLLKMSAGLAFFVGFSFKIVASQTEAVGIVAMVRACADVVCALLFQVVFYRRYPDVYHWCGAVVVMVSLGIIGVHKWKRLRIR